MSQDTYPVSEPNSVHLLPGDEGYVQEIVVTSADELQTAFRQYQTELVQALAIQAGAPDMDYAYDERYKNPLWLAGMAPGSKEERISIATEQIITPVNSYTSFTGLRVKTVEVRGTNRAMYELEIAMEYYGIPHSISCVHVIGISSSESQQYRVTEQPAKSRRGLDKLERIYEVLGHDPNMPDDLVWYVNMLVSGDYQGIRAKYPEGVFPARLEPDLLIMLLESFDIASEYTDRILRLYAFHQQSFGPYGNLKPDAEIILPAGQFGRSLLRLVLATAAYRKPRNPRGRSKSQNRASSYRRAFVSSNTRKTYAELQNLIEDYDDGSYYVVNIVPASPDKVKLPVGVGSQDVFSVVINRFMGSSIAKVTSVTLGASRNSLTICRL